jgi:predicted dehydrogenase
MATKLAIPRVATTLSEILGAVRPDLLVVATPPATHHELVLEGLAAGCHII